MTIELSPFDQDLTGVCASCGHESGFHILVRRNGVPRNTTNLFRYLQSTELPGTLFHLCQSCRDDLCIQLTRLSRLEKGLDKPNFR